MRKDEIHVEVSQQPDGKWSAEAKHPSHWIWSVKVADAETEKDAEDLCRRAVEALTFGKDRR